MKRRIVLAALVGGTTFTPWLYAAASPEEAAKLKTTLTPLGAERAANKDGSIPAWDGGMTKAPRVTRAATRGPTPLPPRSRSCPSAPRTWHSTKAS